MIHYRLRFESGRENMMCFHLNGLRSMNILARRVAGIGWQTSNGVNVRFWFSRRAEDSLLALVSCLPKTFAARRVQGIATARSP